MYIYVYLKRTMSLKKDFRDFLSCLNNEETVYLLIGSYAVCYYTGDPCSDNFTIWAEPSEINAQRIWRALAIFGAPLKDIKPIEFKNPGYIYQIGFKPNHITIVMDAAGIDFLTAWKNRIACSYDDIDTYTVSKKELILNLKAMNRSEDHVNLERLSKI
jgi:hypothetical protein